MKAVLIILMSLWMTGCYSGKDPVDDYPELQNFVPEYEPAEPKVFTFETQYGIDKDSLIYTYDPTLQANALNQFQFEFVLSGRWSQRFEWELNAEKNDFFKNVEIEAVDMNRWLVSGQVLRTNDNRNALGEKLYLTVIPMDTNDAAFLKAVESLAIEPVYVMFSSNEQ